MYDFLTIYLHHHYFYRERAFEFTPEGLERLREGRIELSSEELIKENEKLKKQIVDLKTLAYFQQEREHWDGYTESISYKDIVNNYIKKFGSLEEMAYEREK